MTFNIQVPSLNVFVDRGLSPILRVFVWLSSIFSAGEAFATLNGLAVTVLVGVALPTDGLMNDFEKLLFLSFSFYCSSNIWISCLINSCLSILVYISDIIAATGLLAFVIAKILLLLVLVALLYVY